MSVWISQDGSDVWFQLSCYVNGCDKIMIRDSIDTVLGKLSLGDRLYVSGWRDGMKHYHNVFQIEMSSGAIFIMDEICLF